MNSNVTILGYTLVGLLLSGFGFGESRAEIATDGTLGPARSLTGPDYQITPDLGAQAGGNLFHSFQVFSIARDERATFSGPASIRNIIGRVTGGVQSSIDGALRSTIPGADLYLLNPAGVLLGENARLDIGGSLFLTTADHLELQDGGRFSATHPDATLLSVAAPASFGFVEGEPGAIELRGSRLEVGQGRGIALIGGDLSLQGGSLQAASGQIQLYSVSAPSRIGVQGENATADLTANRTNLRLEQGMQLEASGSPGGRIVLSGGQIFAQDAQIRADSSGENTAGRGLRLQAGESILLDAASVQSGSSDGATAGAALIEAPQVVLRNGAFVDGSSAGGRGAQIRVESGSLRLEGASGLLANAYGSGTGGDIEVIASDRIEIVGDAQTEGWAGGMTTASLSDAPAGSITLHTGELRVQDAWVEAATYGAGAAGTVEVNAAGDVNFDNGRLGAYTQGSGSAGTIRLRAEQVRIDRDGGLIALSLGGGSGSGGSVEVDAQRLVLTDGGEITNEAWPGTVETSGDIRITLGDELLIRGRREPSNENPGSDRVSTGIFSFTGDIAVSAPDINLSDSGVISTRTFGDYPSGTLTVNADRITLLDGAEINADSFGSSLTYGKSGDVRVTASEQLRLSGRIPASSEGRDRPSAIRAATRSNGDAGTIDIRSPLVIVENDAAIFTTTGVFGDGAAGRISIQADQLVLRSGGDVLSSSIGYGGGGGIDIDAAKSVELDHGVIDAIGFRFGQSGEIRVETPYLVMRGGSITTATRGTEDAGDISIEVDRLDLLDGSKIRSDSDDTGDAGRVTVHAGRLLNAEGSEITTGAERSGGGNILLQAETIRLRTSPVTATVAGGTGDGGNVGLDAAAIAATDESDITARADQGRGGRIVINAEVFLRDASVDLDASSNVIGNEGIVEVNAPELDLSASVKELEGEYLDAAGLLRDKCGASARSDQGSLLLRPRGGLAPGPEDYLLGMVPVAEMPGADTRGFGPGGVGTVALCSDSDR